MPSRFRQEAAVKDTHPHFMKDQYVPVPGSEQQDMLLSRRALASLEHGITDHISASLPCPRENQMMSCYL
jgi:hypothetical protein